MTVLRMSMLMMSMLMMKCSLCHLLLQNRSNEHQESMAHVQ